MARYTDFMNIDQYTKVYHTITNSLHKHREYSKHFKVFVENESEIEAAIEYSLDNLYATVIDVFDKLIESHDDN